MARKPTGRRKVELVKIADKKDLQATFSRRRIGIFKKAHELSVLCGVEIAIIVFSPGKKAFTFGHPNVQTVTEYLLTKSPQAKSTLMQNIEGLRKANVQELHMQLVKVQQDFEAEKQREKRIEEMMEAKKTQHWWEKPLDELDTSHLQKLKTYLGGLQQIFQGNMKGQM